MPKTYVQNSSLEIAWRRVLDGPLPTISGRRLAPFFTEGSEGFSIDYPERVDRWRPLVHWLLIIPYALVAGILLYLAELMVFFAFFTILFTKTFPEGLFRLALIPLRWAARANAYRDWLVTRYPPFVWD